MLATVKKSRCLLFASFYQRDRPLSKRQRARLNVLARFINRAPIVVSARIQATGY